MSTTKSNNTIRSRRTTTVITAASSIWVATLLLLTGLIPTAIIASAASNGATGDDTLQRTPDDDRINALADSPIELGTWYEFLFFEAGSFATGCPEGDVLPRCIPSPGTPTTFAPNPPWTFEAPASGAELKVTDAFGSGDQFEVFDFGKSIGTTSFPTARGSCGDDPVPCFSNPNYSHGTFSLDAGPHSITIKVIRSPFGIGAAYFRVDPITTTALTADIDIKPDDDDGVSTINTKSKGTTTVAILGNEEFGDVSEVDISSIEFAGASPSSTKPRLEDVNGDGIADLILKFNTQAMDELQVGDTEACLVGELNDGTPFEGCDEVRVI